MNSSRRSVIAGAGALAVLGVLGGRSTAASRPSITVYKEPT
jgi:hypothetical protein